MKKILILALALTMAASFMACSSKDEQAAPADDTVTPVEENVEEPTEDVPEIPVEEEVPAVESDTETTPAA